MILADNTRYKISNLRMMSLILGNQDKFIRLHINVGTDNINIHSNMFRDFIIVYNDCIEEIKYINDIGNNIQIDTLGGIRVYCSDTESKIIDDKLDNLSQCEGLNKIRVCCFEYDKLDIEDIYDGISEFGKLKNADTIHIRNYKMHIIKYDNFSLVIVSNRVYIIDYNLDSDEYDRCLNNVKEYLNDRLGKYKKCEKFLVR